MPGDDSMVESFAPIRPLEPRDRPPGCGISTSFRPPHDGPSRRRSVVRFEDALVQGPIAASCWTEAATRPSNRCHPKSAIPARRPEPRPLPPLARGPLASAAQLPSGAIIASIGETEEAVDLEALCQLVAPAKDEDLVEQVQLIVDPQEPRRPARRAPGRRIDRRRRPFARSIPMTRRIRPRSTASASSTARRPEGSALLPIRPPTRCRRSKGAVACRPGGRSPSKTFDDGRLDKP